MVGLKDHRNSMGMSRETSSLNIGVNKKPSARNVTKVSKKPSARIGRNAGNSLVLPGIESSFFLTDVDV